MGVHRQVHASTDAHGCSGVQLSFLRSHLHCLLRQSLSLASNLSSSLSWLPTSPGLLFVVILFGAVIPGSCHQVVIVDYQGSNSSSCFCSKTSNGALSQLSKKPFESVANITKYLGHMDDAEDNGYNKSGQNLSNMKNFGFNLQNGDLLRSLYKMEGKLFNKSRALSSVMGYHNPSIILFFIIFTLIFTETTLWQPLDKFILNVVQMCFYLSLHSTSTTLSLPLVFSKCFLRKKKKNALQESYPYF